MSMCMLCGSGWSALTRWSTQSRARGKVMIVWLQAAPQQCTATEYVTTEKPATWRATSRLLNSDLEHKLYQQTHVILTIADDLLIASS